VRTYALIKYLSRIVIYRLKVNISVLFEDKVFITDYVHPDHMLESGVAHVYNI